MFALKIEVSRMQVDVNVTPDKRTVMLTHENQLLTLLREALEGVWDPSKFQFSQSLGASGTAWTSEYVPPPKCAVVLLQCGICATYVVAHAHAPVPLHRFGTSAATPSTGSQDGLSYMVELSMRARTVPRLTAWAC
jgi:hypothetical protein